MGFLKTKLGNNGSLQAAVQATGFAASQISTNR
jgi:hypothetical protein